MGNSDSTERSRFLLEWYNHNPLTFQISGTLLGLYCVPRAQVCACGYSAQKNARIPKLRSLLWPPTRVEARFNWRAAIFAEFRGHSR